MSHEQKHPILQKLEEYLKNTPKEQLDEDWLNILKNSDMEAYYEKKYKDALERARKELQEFKNKDCDDTTRRTAINIIRNLFTELKESEDEEIRKAIKSGIKHLEIKLGYDAVDGVDILDIYSWLEKQGNKSVNIDIEPIISSYKQRLISQGCIEYTPLFDMCLTAFRHGVENVLEELNLKTLDADKVIEWLNDQACQGWIEDVEVDKFIAKFKKDLCER